jgi:FkbM family methyltransferase
MLLATLITLASTSKVHNACINRRNAQAQFGEDQILAPILVHLARGGSGSFVELGAVDGITKSNTLLLERCFNFTGLLIEGNPNSARSLLSSGRKATRRHAAVCSPAGTIPFTDQGGLVGGVPSLFTEKHKRRWAHRSNFTTTVNVPCAPLGQMMTEAKLNSATFLSLDVEGAELLVLKTFKPSRFDLIMVETNQNEPERTRQIHELLKSGGMQLQPRLSQMIGNSDVFVRREVAQTVRQCLQDDSLGCNVPACKPAGHRKSLSRGKCLRSNLP